MNNATTTAALPLDDNKPSALTAAERQELSLIWSLEPRLSRIQTARRNELERRMA